jgi:hypothetical protein
MSSLVPSAYKRHHAVNRDERSAQHVTTHPLVTLCATDKLEAPETIDDHLRLSDYSPESFQTCTKANASTQLCAPSLSALIRFRAGGCHSVSTGYPFD